MVRWLITRAPAIFLLLKLNYANQWVALHNFEQPSYRQVYVVKSACTISPQIRISLDTICSWYIIPFYSISLMSIGVINGPITVNRKPGFHSFKNMSFVHKYVHYLRNIRMFYEISGIKLYLAMEITLLIFSPFTSSVVFYRCMPSHLPMPIVSVYATKNILHQYNPREYCGMVKGWGSAKYMHW